MNALSSGFSASALPDVLNPALESALALAAVEVEEGLAPSIGEALGLDAPHLWVLGGLVSPAVAHALFTAPAAPLIPLESEEEALLELLLAECALPLPWGALVCRITARRAMRSDHLWQDMGLPDRTMLSRLIATCWPRLHASNTNNMRWKRLFYRALCAAEGFSLCSVPNCRDCSDFDSCFGEESGDSAFARRVAQAENAIT